MDSVLTKKSGQDEHEALLWMHTSTGKKFYPGDPKAENICMSDIANGLAQDFRYAGQGDINRPYTVAEHCVHLARYVLEAEGWTPYQAFAMLMHDAAEAYLNDLCRAVKREVGASYQTLERKLQNVIVKKYRIGYVSDILAYRIKQFDTQITNMEKMAIMRHSQSWPSDEFEPMVGVNIRCWAPRQAKVEFLKMYEYLCDRDEAIPHETWEI